VLVVNYFKKLLSGNIKHNKSLQHRSATLHWTGFKSHFCGSLRSLYHKNTT